MMITHFCYDPGQDLVDASLVASAVGESQLTTSTVIKRSIHKKEHRRLP